MTPALLVSVLLIAACGLIYELVAGTLASYLLGDSVTQFSTVIGTYLFAMGVGWWLSRFIGRGLVARFILIEIMVGLVGGFSSSILFLAFAYTDSFRLLLYVLVIVIGALVGLEIPLLMRILTRPLRVQGRRRQRADLRLPGRARRFAAVSDRAGAAARSGALADAVRRDQRRRGAVDDGISARACSARAGCSRPPAWWRSRCSARAWSGPTRILELSEGNLYADDVIFARTTPYQRIVLTAWKDDLRLFLNSQSAVQLARRVPLSRGAGAPGTGGAAAARGACWSSAAATASPCARC